MRQTLPKRSSFDNFELELKSGELRRGGALVDAATARSGRSPFWPIDWSGRDARGDSTQEVWGDETFVDYEQGGEYHQANPPRLGDGESAAFSSRRCRAAVSLHA